MKKRFQCKNENIKVLEKIGLHFYRFLKQGNIT